MWNDVETGKDLLNFTIVAKMAAQLVQESAGEPISIGISGSWGTGKSSLVKMIGNSLKEADAGKNKYLFLVQALAGNNYRVILSTLSQ